MNRNLLLVIGMIVALGLISAVLTYFRSEKMTPPADLAAKGLAAAQRGNAVFFGVFMPVLVGVIAFFVYRGMLARSPDTVETSFLLLAIGVAVVLTIMAAVVFKMRALAEFTTLHILYVAGFGWLLPRLLAR
jgi:hypothetical protein